MANVIFGALTAAFALFGLSLIGGVSDAAFFPFGTALLGIGVGLAYATIHRAAAARPVAKVGRRRV